MAMKITPFGKSICFAPDKKDSFIESAEKLTMTGTVTHIGDGVTKIRVGDRIAFNEYGAWQTEIGGETYYFVTEQDDVILCTFDEDSQ